MKAPPLRVEGHSDILLSTGPVVRHSRFRPYSLAQYWKVAKREDTQQSIVVLWPPIVRLEDELLEDTITDGFFYVTVNREAIVRTPVIEWQEKLRTHPRQQGGSGVILMGLLNIIEKVLDIDPDTRIKAEQLSKDLGDLLKLDGMVDALSTIAEYSPTGHTFPPSEMSTPPIVRVKTPVETSSATTSRSNSPEKKQRISTESRTSVSQMEI
ncbi:hypothetical protein B0J14DRAFT_688114 [Halenospora varia]|nr:hypothetical protein B0J14DRAFT_688114 [Halenospora varia]